MSERNTSGSSRRNDASASSLSREQQQLTLEEKEENVFVITLTGEKPNRANVFDEALVERLNLLLDEVEQKLPCALVVTGIGKFFSAGFDLKVMTGSDKGRVDRMIVDTWNLLARLLVFPAPTICVFSGHAFGLGLFLGLACDHRLMATAAEERSSRLCLPEIDIGLPLGVGFAALAKCKMTPSTLRTAAMTGKRWSRAEALEAGILDRAAAIVPEADDSDDKEEEMATSSSDALGAAVRMARRLVPTSDKPSVNDTTMRNTLQEMKMEMYQEAYEVLAAKRSKL